MKRYIYFIFLINTLFDLRSQTKLNDPKLLIQNTTDLLTLERTNQDDFYITHNYGSYSIWNSRYHIKLNDFLTYADLFYFDANQQRVAYFPTDRKKYCILYDAESNLQIDSIYIKNSYDVKKILLVKNVLFLVFENKIITYNWGNKIQSTLYSNNTTIHNVIVTKDSTNESLVVLRDQNQVDKWTNEQMIQTIKLKIDLKDFNHLMVKTDYYNNKLAISCSNEVTLWELSTGRLISKIKCKSEFPSATILRSFDNRIFIYGRIGWYSEIFDYANYNCLDTIPGTNFIDFPTLEKAIFKSHFSGRYLVEISLRNWLTREIKPSCSKIDFINVSNDGNEIFLGHSSGGNDITQIILNGGIRISNKKYSNSNVYCGIGSKVYSNDFTNKSYVTACAKVFNGDSIQYFSINGKNPDFISPKANWAYEDELDDNSYIHKLTFYSMSDKKSVFKIKVFQNFNVYFTPSEQYLFLFEDYVTFSEDDKTTINIYNTSKFKEEGKIQFVRRKLSSNCLSSTDSMLFFVADPSPDGDFERIFTYDIKQKIIIDSFETNSSHVTKIQISQCGKYLAIYDYSVKKIKLWHIANRTIIAQVQLNNNPFDIKFSKHDSLIVISSVDGDIVLWYWQKLNKINFFPLEDCNFLAVLNSKYYYMSKGANSKVFYKKGKQIYPFEQFDLLYNRPDKILEATQSTDNVIIEMYKKAYEKRMKRLGMNNVILNDSLVAPLAEIKNRHKISYLHTNSTIKIDVLAFDSIFKLDRLNIWVNNVPLYGEKGFSLKSRLTNLIDTTLLVELSDGENEIEYSVLNSNGVESYSSSINVKYMSDNTYNPKTYFIGIGINEFKEYGHNLSYSVKDARDLAHTLSEKLGDQLIVDTLFNEKVNVTNVKKLKEKLLKTNVSDKIIISYSGHGILDEDYNYFLSSYDMDFSNPALKGISFESLEDLLDSIPARKKLLLLDACHSGEVDKEEFSLRSDVSNDKGIFNSKGATLLNSTLNQKLGRQNSFELMTELFINLQKGSGATVISAAAGNQFAREREDLKNGIFSYVILKYLKEHDETTISALKKYVYEEVDKLSGGLQKPTFRKENLNVDWKIW